MLMSSYTTPKNPPVDDCALLLAKAILFEVPNEPFELMNQCKRLCVAKRNWFVVHSALMELERSIRDNKHLIIFGFLMG